MRKLAVVLLVFMLLPVASATFYYDDISALGYNVTATNFFVGSTSLNNLISTSSSGSGSTPLFIGNQQIATLNDLTSSGSGGWTNNSENTTTTLNVGIGTTAPLRMLTVDGSGAAIRINAPTSPFLDISSAGSSQWYVGTNLLTSNNTFEIRDVNATGGSGSRLVIDQSGNVGIGTSTPQTRMQIFGTDYPGSTLRLTRESNSIFGPHIEFEQRRSGGASSEDGDRIGTLRFNAYNGTDTTANLVEIGAFVDNITQEDSSLSFSTSDDGVLREQIRITPNGRVGIRTNVPLALLDVNGSIRLQNGTWIGEFSTDGTLAGDSDNVVPTEQAVRTFVEAQVGGISSSSAGGWTNNSENTTTTLNVGIGTTNPSADLTVNGDLIVTNFSATSYSTIFDSSNTYALGVSGSGSTDIVALGTTSSRATIAGLTSGGSPSNLLINPAGGQVGLSTSSFITGEDLRVGGYAIFGTTGQAIIGDDGSNAFIGGYSETDVVFRANNTEVIRLDASGTVGIGTTDPSAFLDVNAAQNNALPGLRVGGYQNNAPYYTMARFDPGNTNGYLQGALTFESDDYDVAAIGYAGPDDTGTSGYLTFSTRQSGTLSEALRIDQQGDVGIGVTDPTAPFDVRKNNSALAFDDWGGTAALYLDGADGDRAGGDYSILRSNSAGTLDIYSPSLSGRFDSSGNFGVEGELYDISDGTVTVGESLTVDIDADSQFFINNAGTDAVYLRAATGDTLYVGGDNTWQALFGSSSIQLNTGIDLDLNNNAITNIDWSTSDDGSGSGLDADLLDGQNGAYYLDDTTLTEGEVEAFIFDTDNTGTLATTGNLRADAFVGETSSGGLHITSPGGAKYSTTSSSVAGAIKITLPTSWSNTMMRMTVKVYEYDNDESITIELGGYNYAPTTSWFNTFATITADDSDRDFNVRFGHDGTANAIWIGENTSGWAYPQVVVEDFYAGYGGFAESTWDDGWDVSFDTSFVGDTISATESANFPYSDWNRMTNIPAAFTDGSIALGSETTGAYVAGVSGGTAISVSGSGGEGSTPSVSVTADSIGNTQLQFDTGQALTTSSSPSFAGMTIASGASDVNLYMGNTGYGLFLDYSEGDLVFRTNTGNRVFVNNNGALEVGTGTINSATSAGDLYVADQLEVDGTSFFGGNLRVTTDDDGIEDADGTERITFDSSGNNVIITVG